MHGHELVRIVYGYLGHVGIFCAWSWKKDLVVVYGHVKNFDCGFWWGIDFFVVIGHWL